MAIETKRVSKACKLSRSHIVTNCFIFIHYRSWDTTAERSSGNDYFTNSVAIPSSFLATLFSWQIVKAIMWQNRLRESAWGNFDSVLATICWYDVFESKTMLLRLRSGCKFHRQKAPKILAWNRSKTCYC